jgi:hypothetical protein
MRLIRVENITETRFCSSRRTADRRGQGNGPSSTNTTIKLMTMLKSMNGWGHGPYHRDLPERHNPPGGVECAIAHNDERFS